MIGTLILTHGGAAGELLAAAQKIAGPLPEFEALGLDWNEPVEKLKGEVSAAVERLDHGQGVLILTDMFGSTPCNVASSFLAEGRVEILSGVNLPMVMRLACQPRQGGNLKELARWLQAKTQKSVCLASDQLTGKKCGDHSATGATGEAVSGAAAAVGAATPHD
ncbi:MAG TPA: PTS sugar transporter subunit IIA [Thermoanaerobaculia bacterium]|jgi:PTS system mannose-specific IIA component|nr:PTS sugar transporter subunit IIA [Thermoanaerobaculia bacterium]